MFEIEYRNHATFVRMYHAAAGDGSSDQRDTCVSASREKDAFSYQIDGGGGM